MVRRSYIYTLFSTNMLCCIFIVLSHWNNSPQVDMSLYSDKLIWSQPVFALTPCSCVFSRDATNTNVLVFGLTRPVLDNALKG